MIKKTKVLTCHATAKCGTRKVPRGVETVLKSHMSLELRFQRTAMAASRMTL